MPIDRENLSDSGDLNFALRDPEHLYTHEEICDLLEAAERLGFSLEKGSELEGLTIRELDKLVHTRQ